jgi:hypothetical protein
MNKPSIYKQMRKNDQLNATFDRTEITSRSDSIVLLKLPALYNKTAYVKKVYIIKFSLISNKRVIHQGGKGFGCLLVIGGCFICVMVFTGQ